MAYITKETTKEIRNALKAAFPNLKFSVTMEHHSSLHVAIMKGNVDFGGNDISVNQYCLDRQFEGEALKVWQKVDEIVKTVGNWFDKSDSMTDYFHTAFYIDYNVGKWNKNYEKVS